MYVFISHHSQSNKAPEEREKTLEYVTNSLFSED